MSFPPTVGRYRIDRVLGSGAFASVWLGHDDALDSQVAIKVLSGSLLDDLDVRNRFLEEARILRRADSARLVRVHDIGELPDGRPYFVMSYADLGTLADRMLERPLPVNDALVLAEEIASGVEVINTLGVIHRDLKPSNVLFQSAPDGGERLLIADLGLAKALAHASGAFTLPVGTPGYMSPEQARFGGGLDVRADVYGLGALTYHMLTGRAPGPAPVRTPPSALREGLSPAFDQVILRAMEVEREQRWPTAEAFAEALSTLRPSTVQAPSAPAPPASAPAPSNSAPSTSAPSAPSAPAPSAPGAVTPAPSFYEDSEPDPDSTVRDRYQGPPAAAAHTPQPQGPPQSQGPPQPGPASHGPPPPGPGSQGPPPPGPSSQGPPAGHGRPGQGPSEAATQLDQPIADTGDRTSEMHVPPGQGPQQDDIGEATVVDRPGGRGPTIYRPPESGDRTVALPTPQYPAPPAGGGTGENSKTSVFPVQQPQQPPQRPQQPGGYGPGGPGGHPGPGPGGPAGPGGPSGPGGPTGPGGTTGPGGGAPYPAHQDSPPPTGFQPPPPGGPGAQPGGGGTGRAPKKFLTPLIITAVVLTVALVGGLALGTLFSGDGKEKEKQKPPAIPADFTPVSDRAGKIKLSVPKAWPGQSEQTWQPSSVGLADQQARPVLRATPGVATFVGDGKSPGIFVGLTTDLAAGKLPPPSAAVHPRCTKANPEPYTSPDKALTGTITRFTGCPAGTPSVTEIGLKDRSGRFGAWIRIKENDNRNLTKTLLDNLKLSAP